MVGVIAITLLAVGLFTTGITTKVFAGDLVSVTDNVKIYDEETKTATITDKADKVLVTAKLLTPTINKVGLGYQRVAEIEFETFEDYTTFEDMLSKIELYDVKNEMESFERRIDYKYKTTESYSVDDYTCSDETLKNETIINPCTVTGSHLEYRDTWLDLNEKVAYTKGNLVVGLYTTTYEGENVEWIPTIESIKVEEWASWSASLDTNLVHWWGFDEASGNIIDLVGSLDFTNNGGDAQQTGKVNEAYYFNDAIGDYAITSSNSGLEGDVVMSGNIWFKKTTNQGADQNVFDMGQPAGGGRLQLKFDSSENLVMDESGSWSFSFGAAANDVWHNIQWANYGNGTGIARLNDGTWKSVSANLGIQAGKIALSYQLNSATIGITGYVDEFGIWTRVLTFDEFDEVQNWDLGCGYQNCISDVVDCQFAGYVFDENDAALENANITIWNQDNIAENYNDGTDANGYWAVNITNSTNTYMVGAYFNNSLIGQLKPYVSGQC